MPRSNYFETSITSATASQLATRSSTAASLSISSFGRENLHQQDGANLHTCAVSTSPVPMMPCEHEHASGVTLADQSRISKLSAASGMLCKSMGRRHATPPPPLLAKAEEELEVFGQPGAGVCRHTTEGWKALEPSMRAMHHVGHPTVPGRLPYGVPAWTRHRLLHLLHSTMHEQCYIAVRVACHVHQCSAALLSPLVRLTLWRNHRMNAGSHTTHQNSRRRGLPAAAKWYNARAEHDRQLNTGSRVLHGGACHTTRTSQRVCMYGCSQWRGGWGRRKYHT